MQAVSSRPEYTSDKGVSSEREASSLKTFRLTPFAEGSRATPLKADNSHAKNFITGGTYDPGNKYRQIFIQKRLSYNIVLRREILIRLLYPICSRKAAHPSCTKDPDKYYRYLLDYLRSEKIAAVLPMSDDSAALLSKHRETLSQYTAFAAPSYEVFENGYDKNKLMAACRENDIPHPYTIDLSKHFDLQTMKYPAILKPNITSGARGMVIIHNPEEFWEKYPSIQREYGNCHLQEYIPAGGNQFKVQLYLDKKNNLIQSSAICKYRWYPVHGGSSCCNESIENPDLINTCHKLLEKIKWVGFADFDLIEDPRDHSLKIMELNPRIPACVKSAIVSGIDWGNVIVDDILGNTQNNYTYTPGKFLRFLGFEILWFLKSPDRFKTHPNWFKFFGKNIFYQDLEFTDLKSFLFGTWGNIRKLCNPKFRQTKKGTNK